MKSLNESSYTKEATLYWFLGATFSQDHEYGVLSNMMTALQRSNHKLPFSRIELISTNESHQSLKDMAATVRAEDAIISSCAGTNNALYFLGEIPRKIQSNISYLAFHNYDNNFLKKTVLKILKITIFITSNEMAEQFPHVSATNIKHLIFDNTAKLTSGKEINPRVPYALPVGSIRHLPLTNTVDDIGLDTDVSLTDTNGQHHKIGTIVRDKDSKIVINVTLLNTLLTACQREKKPQAIIGPIIQTLSSTSMKLTQKTTASFDMHVFLSKFMIALGVAAIAIAFATLSLGSLNIVGIAVASTGLLSIGYGGYRLFNHAHSIPQPDSSQGNTLRV